MELTTKLLGDILKINLNGEIDHHIAETIRTKIDYHIDKSGKTKILFDFKHVTFMDSSGIGMIIGRYKRVQRMGGKLGLVNLSDRLKRIFDMSGLLNIISYFENEQDAIDRL